jgi:hypothetical protein
MPWACLGCQVDHIGFDFAQSGDGIDPRAADRGLLGHAQTEQVAVEIDHRLHVLNDDVHVIQEIDHGGTSRNR